MSRSVRPADYGDGEVAEALRDPKAAQLLDVCGEHIGLVVDHMAKVSFGNDERYKVMQFQLFEQHHNIHHLRHRPLQRALQSRYAACQCSPLGRLVIRSAAISGSGAEGLDAPPRPPNSQTTSDSDMMFQLGPVHWTFPGTEEASAGDTAVESTADPRGQVSDPTPRLVISETENLGFVLLLQERRDDCPHQERRPFKAEVVNKFFRDYQLVTIGKYITECSTNGPACSFSRRTNEAYNVADRDEVPCLHVPVWWFSDEFFTRPGNKTGHRRP